MLDINLGNKTLTVGVAIALILAYGMINFDSGNNAAPVFQTVAAGTHEAPSPVAAATPAAEATTTPADEAAAPSDIDVEALSSAQQATAAADLVPVRQSPLRWKLAD